MPAGAKQDFDALLAQKIPCAHDVIHVLDLVVDVLHAAMRGGEQRQRMVCGVDAQQCRVTDPVGHSRVAQLRPEFLVARRVHRIQSDMAEMRDARVAAGEVAHAGVVWLGNELDPVAARIVRGDKRLDTPLLTFLARAEMHRMAGAFQLRAHRVEVRWVVQVEADSLVGRIALEIDQCVVARITAHRDLVAAEIRRLALACDKLQADDVGCEAHRAVKVGRADADVADVVQVDHGCSPPRKT